MKLQEHSAAFLVKRLATASYEVPDRQTGGDLLRSCGARTATFQGVPGST
jgi:hypothetical protein